jgi:hypothetical protein
VSVLWAVTAFSAARVAAVLAINPAAIDHAVARGADDGNVAHDPHGGLHAILHSRPLFLFALSAALFHFASAAILLLAGERLSRGAWC